MLDLTLKNTRLSDGSVVDLSIKNGKIAHVGASFSSNETIDCTGLLCLPGAIDMHVHMRGGSQSYKEDWKSGSMSAVAGGVTLVVDQPNTIPPITNSDIFIRRVNDATEQSYCNFAINGAINQEVNIEEMWAAGAMAFGEIFISQSHHGLYLDTKDLSDILAVLSRIGSLATIHAEVVPSNNATNLDEHDMLRSIESEEKMVSLISSQKRMHKHIHICHCSAPRAIDETYTSVEVTPHHLFLAIEDFNLSDGRAKVNPPLRHEWVRNALWSRWQRIDVIASDHAPHTIDEKTKPFSESPAGIPGVETMVPLFMAMVYDKKILLESLLRKIVYNPAAILGIEPSNLTKGNRADFALFPRQKEKIKVDRLHSKCGWTPYEGFDAVFPELVIINGVCVYRKGEYLQRNGRWFPGRGYIPKDST